MNAEKPIKEGKEEGREKKDKIAMEYRKDCSMKVWGQEV